MVGGSLTSWMVMYRVAVLFLGTISGNVCTSYIVKLTICKPEQSLQGLNVTLGK